MRNFFLTTAALLLLSVSLFGQSNRVFPPDYHPLPNKIEIRILSYDGTTIILELDQLAQLDSFGNLTTLLPEIISEITPAVNTIRDPYTTKRLQYFLGAGSESIFLKEYVAEFNGFKFQDHSLQQVKTRPDTLRITKKLKRSSHKEGWMIHHPIHLTIVLPNLSSLNQISVTAIDSALQKIKSQTTHRTELRKPAYVTYNHQKQDWDFNEGYTMKQKKALVMPAIAVGFQYAHGEWMPSVAAGIQLVRRKSDFSKSVFQLSWEPHFGFGTNAYGDFRTYRNDFITFGFQEHIRPVRKREEENVVRFSVGYLIYRDGDVFHKSTIKFSTPGIHYKSLFLEPEFFFHDFFRDFSPSLKLSYSF